MEYSLLTTNGRPETHMIWMILKQEIDSGRHIMKKPRRMIKNRWKDGKMILTWCSSL